MKNLIIFFCTMCTCVINAQAQSGQKEKPLLIAYYSIKDALVDGDIQIASEKAKELLEQLEKFSTNLDAKSQKSVKDLKQKIKSDASKISGTNSLSVQREAFTPLSTNFFELAKLVSLSDVPVYQFYCPMKQSIWLSKENEVKNPYYGKQMLTCGSLQETIK